MNNKHKPLVDQKYLNLETFRKSGVGVKTPVWFVQDGEVLFVRTLADSGKVKRIRNNTQVNIAPCKMDGAVLAEWVPAAAREVTDPETDRMVDRLLDKKYGLLKKMFYLAEGSNGRKYTTLEMKVSE
jgi:PPOX class probable F420-dependent enzyme